MTQKFYKQLKELVSNQDKLEDELETLRQELYDSDIPNEYDGTCLDLSPEDEFIINKFINFLENFTIPKEFL